MSSAKFYFAIKDKACSNHIDFHECSEYVDVKLADSQLYITVLKDSDELPLTLELNDGTYRLFEFCAYEITNYVRDNYMGETKVVLLYSEEFEFRSYSKNVDIEKLQRLQPLISDEMFTFEMLAKYADIRLLYSVFIEVLLKTARNFSPEKQERVYLEAVKIYDDCQVLDSDIVAKIFGFFRQYPENVAIRKIFDYVMIHGSQLAFSNWYLSGETMINYLLDHKFIDGKQIMYLISGDPMYAYCTNPFSEGQNWRATIKVLAQHPNLSKFIYITMLNEISKHMPLNRSREAVLWFSTKILPLLKLNDYQRQKYQENLVLLQTHKVDITFNKVYEDESIPDLFTITYPNFQLYESLIHSLN